VYQRRGYRVDLFGQQAFTACGQAYQDTNPTELLDLDHKTVNTDLTWTLFRYNVNVNIFEQSCGKLYIYHKTKLLWLSP